MPNEMKRNADEQTADTSEDLEEKPLIRRSSSYGSASGPQNNSYLSPIPEEETAESTPASNFINAECMEICMTSHGRSSSAVQRMWEGEVFDCFDDQWIALETLCCPCITFGHNMSSAGFGSLACQATAYFLLTGGVFTGCQIIGIYTSTEFFRWLSYVMFFIGTGYGAYYRMELRRKFNIYGDDTLDYVTHGCCSWCALCQEARTLEANVSNGVWSGRGSQVTTVGQPLPLRDMPPLSQKMSFRVDNLEAKHGSKSEHQEVEIMVSDVPAMATGSRMRDAV